MGRVRQTTPEYVMVRSNATAADEVAYARRVLRLPATFSLVYESSDGRLCLFEDAVGHLNAVDASRLA